MNKGCPSCGSKNLRPSQSDNILESIGSLFGFGPVRCRECEHRFSEAKLWLPTVHYARCPKCFREDLSDWAEKYFYPPFYSRMLLHVGAKAHRCSVCRNNFVSFFPRKREFTPSWKVKKNSAIPEASGKSGPVNIET